MKNIINSQRDIQTTIHRLLKLKAEMATIKAEIEELVADLVEYCKSAGLKTLRSGDTKVTWVHVDDTLVFDSKAFKADHPDLYAQYCTKTKTGREYLR